MKLLNSLYSIQDYGRTSTGLDSVVTLALNPDHFIFRAHFPNQPIMPGVCIVQMCVELLAQSLSTHLQLTAVKNIKFLNVISPTSTSSLTIEFHKTIIADAQVSTQATVKNETTTYAKLSLITRR